MLATLVEKLPTGEGWLFEPKWDGYRALGYVRGGEATLRSRRGNDLTERFAVVAKALPNALRTPDAVVDGEVCALDDDRPPELLGDATGQAGDAARLRGLRRPRDRRRTAHGTAADRAPRAARAARRPVGRRPGLRRVRRRRRALRGGEGAGTRRRDGQEGRVAVQGRRSRRRLAEDQDARPAGVRDLRLDEGPGPTRREASARSCSASATAKDVSSGSGTSAPGSTSKTIDELLTKLRPLERETTPFAAPPKMPKVRKGDVVWVEPKLVCEVEFLEWTHDGHLRAPSFQGLRDDKSARAVKREEPAGDGRPRPQALEPRQALLARGRSQAGRSRRATSSTTTAQSRPSSCRISKSARSRCGAIPTARTARRSSRRTRQSTCRNGSRAFAVEVSTRERPPQRRMIEAPLVNDERALLWMANMGCIDMNAWYSRVDKPERPDFVLFDLDPSPDVGIKEVVEVALHREAGARRAWPRLLPEDVERRRDARARADRAALDVRADARVLRDRRRRARRHAPRPRHDGMVEGETDAASSSTRTRTAAGRRSRRRTRCGRGRERRSRRRCAGTR